MLGICARGGREVLMKAKEMPRCMVFETGLGGVCYGGWLGRG